MSTWLINGSTPETLGLRIVGGEFRAGGPSTVTLEANAQFDAAEAFSYGDEVTITRDGAPYFTGTARLVPKRGTGAEEAIRYVVEDAWADLERTTYQEEWQINGAGVLLPMVVLGLKQDGTRIDVGAQIAEVLAFAADAGIPIQAGTMPTGMNLWPAEASGVSCAEVIRTSLRLHPDWIPWIDHTTTPPTFNVTPAATATARSLAVPGAVDVNVTKRDARLPNCVRIVFTTATDIDGTVYRDATVQKYPVDGPDSGPGVLCVQVELAGGSASIQKQQVTTRTLPATGATQTAKKNWLNAKFPWLAGVDPDHYSVDTFSLGLIENPDTEPDAINPHALPLPLESLDDAPRELVKGAVHEWMRKRVGQIQVGIEITPVQTGANKADDDERKLLESIPTTFTVTGTNAQTRVYRGRLQWKTTAEQAPAGIAQAYYNTIAAGCLYEGSVTILEEDVGATRWHGSAINLTGGVTGWATMKAPIHNVRWDLQSQLVTISFGPNPDYSVQDFIEYLRLLRSRGTTWMAGTERTSSELGAESEPSAKGDVAGPKEVPQKEAGFPPRGANLDLWLDSPGSPAILRHVIRNGQFLGRVDDEEAPPAWYYVPDTLIEAGRYGRNVKMILRYIGVGLIAEGGYNHLCDPEVLSEVNYYWLNGKPVGTTEPTGWGDLDFDTIIADQLTWTVVGSP